MGPTAVIPKSHWLGVDREGFFNSEERYILSHRPANHKSRAFTSWEEAEAELIAEERSIDPVDVRDKRRMHELTELLGAAHGELEQKRLLVPAGTARHSASLMHIHRFR